MWNTILGAVHLGGVAIFLSQQGRVCAGWYIQRQEVSGVITGPVNDEEYLRARGAYFIVSGFFGLATLIAYIAIGHRAYN